MTNGGTSCTHAGQAADHRQPADAAELVHGHAARDVRPVADCHVAAQHRAVGQDHVVADACSRGPRAAPTMNRQRLPIRVTCPASSARWTVTFSRNHVAVADLDVGPGCSGMWMCCGMPPSTVPSSTRLSRPSDVPDFTDDAAGQVTAVAEHDSGSTTAERADPHIGSKLGVRTDDSKRVNRHRWVLLLAEEPDAGEWAAMAVGGGRAVAGARQRRLRCFIGRNNYAGLAGGGDFSHLATAGVWAGGVRTC